MSHSLPPPSAGDGNENVGQFLDECRLLLRRQHQVAVALGYRRERRKNSAANPEVGVAHVRAFFRTFETKEPPQNNLTNFHRFGFWFLGRMV